VHHDEDQTSHDEKDLDVELEKTATRLPVEAPPGVKEADATSATNNLGYDLAIERAVERHDGVLVLGEDGGLDTDHGDDGGKAQEQGAGDADDDDGDEADDERGPLGAVVFADIFRVDAIETEELSGTLGDVDGDIGHGSVNGSREGEDLPVGAGRNALPEAGGAGHRNDLVRPGGVQVGSQSTSEGADNDHTERDKGGKDALDHVANDGEGNSPESMVPESPEAGKTSTLSDQVFDGGADRRGKRLLVYECHGRGSLEEALLLVLGGGLFGGGDGDRGGGSLDHAERGDDVLEHVFDLVIVSLGVQPGGEGKGFNIQRSGRESSRRSCQRAQQCPPWGSRPRGPSWHA